MKTLKPYLLVVACLVLVKVHAQLEKHNFIVGVEAGFNNQVVTALDDKIFWYAKGYIPVGLNTEFCLTNNLSLGIRGNIANMTAWYNDGYHTLDEVSYWSLSGGLYSIYHYYNTEHCVVGSGLSVGYRSATYDYADFKMGDEGVKYDVILVDLKAIFEEHLGIQFNIYLRDNYSSFATVGMFWRF